MRYFSIDELCASDTARARKINNNPDNRVRARLEELIDCVLDPIREQWGSGIRITSGYRCSALNRAVGGSATSAHISGYAADTVPSNQDMQGYKKTVLEWAKKNLFDQIILEYPDRQGNPRWIHVAIRNAYGLQRRQVLVTHDGKTYKPVSLP